MASRRSPRLAIGSVFLIVTAVSACNDPHVVGPVTYAADASRAAFDQAGAPAQAPLACVRLKVRLDDGHPSGPWGWYGGRGHEKDRDLIRVEVLDGECGSLHIVLDSRASFDRHTNLVRLPLAVENRGGGQVRAPVLLLGWEDSLKVRSPRGLARNRHEDRYLRFVSPDTTWAPDDPAHPGAVGWFLEEASSTDSAVLQSFGPRRIKIHVRDGVHEFEVVLRAEAQQAGIRVPEQAPDSVPEGVMANVDPEYGVPVDYLTVTFVPGLTPAAKGAILAEAGGAEVVGGFPLPRQAPFDQIFDGIYLVRIKTDGTMTPLLQALETLGAKPEVVAASMVTQLAPSWRGPQDGTGWDTWQPSPRFADGQNWGPELVAAPHAWGCTTGSTTPSIYVFDQEFARVTDLLPNLADTLNSTGPGSHGTRLASIIAAAGDNQTGMTGMMWTARLHLVDVSQGPRNFTEEVITRTLAAIASGVQVVNWSNGYYWQAIRNRRPNPASHADSTVVLNIGDALQTYIANLATTMPDRMPLFAIAAGNDSVDAFWSAMPLLAQHLPDYVMVVGGARHQTLRPDGSVDFWGGSNYGSLVDIAAPAEDVYSLDRNGNVSPESGTSFAAPFVTGVAGLLLSFDPRLTPADLKALILAGAARHGRHVVGTGGPYPLLDAYGALEAAAERPGGPLCGNRMWIDGTKLVVQRGTQLDSIAAASGNLDAFNTYHGGRQVLVRKGSSYQLLAYQNNTWVAHDTIPLDEGVSGATRSIAGLSHDADSTAFIQQVTWNPDPSARLRLFVGSTGQYTDLHLFHPGFIPNYDGNPSNNRKRALFSPTGESIIAQIKQWNGPFEIYRYDIGGGAVTQLFTVNTPQFHGAVSEDGQEIAALSFDCQLAFYSTQSGARVAGPFQLARSGGYCYFDYLVGFAP